MWNEIIERIVEADTLTRPYKCPLNIREGCTNYQDNSEDHGLVHYVSLRHICHRMATWSPRSFHLHL